MVPAPETFSFSRIGRFIWHHRWFIAAFPLVVVWGTLVHELAHATACVLAGGDIQAFSIIPSRHPDGLRLGYVQYANLPPDANDALLSLAPAIAALALASASAVVFGRGSVRARWHGLRFLYLLLLILPLADISMGSAGLFRGAPSSDFYSALSGYELETGIIVTILLGTFGVFGLRGFRRVCGHELSASEWWLGYALMMLLPHARWAAWS